MPHRDCNDREKRARNTSTRVLTRSQQQKGKKQAFYIHESSSYDSFPPMLLHDAATAGGVVVVVMVTLIHRQPKQNEPESNEDLRLSNCFDLSNKSNGHMPGPCLGHLGSRHRYDRGAGDATEDSNRGRGAESGRGCNGCRT